MRMGQRRQITPRPPRENRIRRPKGLHCFQEAEPWRQGEARPGSPPHPTAGAGPSEGPAQPKTNPLGQGALATTTSPSK
jgi:hypothetical protein